MRNLFLICATVALASACSKTEQQPKKAVAIATPSQAQSAPGGTVGEVDAATRERLARQEAASKMFDPKVPAPAPVPAKPAEAPKPAGAPKPAEAPKPPEAPKPVEAPKPTETAKAAEKAPEKASPPKVVETPPPAPQPTKAEPPIPSKRVDVAAAKPTAAAPIDLTPRIVTRVDPEFPREATQSGTDNGVVKARMTLDNSGNVTRVEVVEANPRRIFDRAVTRALSQWKFNEGPSGRTYETEIIFKR